MLCLNPLVAIRGHWTWEITMTISLKDRAFHGELHRDAEVAWQLAQQLRLEVNSEIARFSTGGGPGPSTKQVTECNKAEDSAAEFRRRELAVMSRLFA